MTTIDAFYHFRSIWKHEETKSANYSPGHVIRYIQETICPESATITNGIKNLRKVWRYQKS